MNSTKYIVLALAGTALATTAVQAGGRTGTCLCKAVNSQIESGKAATSAAGRKIVVGSRSMGSGISNSVTSTNEVRSKGSTGRHRAGANAGLGMKVGLGRTEGHSHGMKKTIGLAGSVSNDSTTVVRLPNVKAAQSGQAANVSVLNKTGPSQRSLANVSALNGSGGKSGKAANVSVLNMQGTTDHSAVNVAALNGSGAPAGKIVNVSVANKSGTSGRSLANVSALNGSGGTAGKVANISVLNKDGTSGRSAVNVAALNGSGGTGGKVANVSVLNKSGTTGPSMANVAVLNGAPAASPPGGGSGDSGGGSGGGGSSSGDGSQGGAGTGVTPTDTSGRFGRSGPSGQGDGKPPAGYRHLEERPINRF